MPYIVDSYMQLFGQCQDLETALELQDREEGLLAVASLCQRPEMGRWKCIDTSNMSDFCPQANSGLNSELVLFV